VARGDAGGGGSSGGSSSHGAVRTRSVPVVDG
jgi:hypothetical protein